MNRVLGTFAPVGAIAATVIAMGINFFTYWINPWSVAAWGVGFGLIAISTVYYGLRRQEKGLMLLGVCFCILAFVVFLVPDSDPRPAYGRFALDVTVDLVAIQVWYRLSAGHWSFVTRWSADEIAPRDG